MRGLTNIQNLIKRTGLSRRSWMIVAGVVLAFVIGGLFLTIFFARQSKKPAAYKSEKVVVDKRYDLASLDIKGKKKEPIKATLKSVQKTNRTIINNKVTASRAGTTYVILTFIIENTTNERTVFPTQTYVRFIDPNNKKFAPSISNKAVLVEPQATRIDTIGFSQPDDIKSMKFSIGELDQPKETIEVKFKD